MSIASLSTLSTMALSDVWKSLPHDLTEEVFSQLVELCWDTDPAYVWVSLRQLSGHQKRVIEPRFAAFWVPKTTVTLYSGARHRFEYGIDGEAGTVGANDGSGMVTFAVLHQSHTPLLGLSQNSIPGTMAQRRLRETWQRYHTSDARNLTVRLGEGFLSRGCRGGYLLNDTRLPGLTTMPGGKITFQWKGAINELLREEMYMRKVGEQMVCAPFPLGASLAHPRHSSSTLATSGVSTCS